MHDRVPGAPGQYKASVSAEELTKMQAGEQFAITLTRDDQPIKEGTPYNKASVLPDDVASAICPDVTDPTPADAFRELAKQVTNAANGTFQEMAYLGDDPVTVETDTPAAWIALGDGFAGITTVCTENQPVTYGVIINRIVQGFNVHQLFVSAHGELMFRGGNVQGWNSQWAMTYCSNFPIILKEGIHYGSAFPEDAEVGTVFWIPVVSADG